MVGTLINNEMFILMKMQRYRSNTYWTPNWYCRMCIIWFGSFNENTKKYDQDTKVQTIEIEV